MHACDIPQYLIRQNSFWITSPRFTLANNLSYTYSISAWDLTGL